MKINSIDHPHKFQHAEKAPEGYFWQLSTLGSSVFFELALKKRGKFFHPTVSSIVGDASYYGGVNIRNFIQNECRTLIQRVERDPKNVLKKYLAAPDSIEDSQE